MPDKPAYQALYDAVRDYASQTTGSQPLRVTIRCANGSSVTVGMPVESPTTTVEPQAVSESPSWTFSGRFACYHGLELEIGGKPRAVLELLASRLGDWVTLAEIRRTCWPQHGADERTIQNAVSNLRKLLKAKIDMEPDTNPIEVDGDRYRLFLS